MWRRWRQAARSQSTHILTGQPTSSCSFPAISQHLLLTSHPPVHASAPSTHLAQSLHPLLTPPAPDHALSLEQVQHLRPRLPIWRADFAVEVYDKDLTDDDDRLASAVSDALFPLARPDGQHVASSLPASHPGLSSTQHSPPSSELCTAREQRCSLSAAPTALPL